MGFEPPRSPKSAVAALLLCFFLGPLGVHRFYVGKIGTGILQIITLGGFGVWVLIDFILIACGQFRDSYGRLLTFADPKQSGRTHLIAVLIFLAVLTFIFFYWVRDSKQIIVIKDRYRVIYNWAQGDARQELRKGNYYLGQLT